MNYTFYLPLPANCSVSQVIGLEAAIGGPEGPQYVVPDISFTAGLEDNEEWTSSITGDNDNISRGNEGGPITPLRRD